MRAIWATTECCRRYELRFWAQVNKLENLSSFYDLSQSLISLRLNLFVCEIGIKIAAISRVATRITLNYREKYLA